MGQRETKLKCFSFVYVLNQRYHQTRQPLVFDVDQPCNKYVEAADITLTTSSCLDTYTKKPKSDHGDICFLASTSMFNVIDYPGASCRVAHGGVGLDTGRGDIRRRK